MGYGFAASKYLYPSLVINFQPQNGSFLCLLQPFFFIQHSYYWVINDMNVNMKLSQAVKLYHILREPRRNFIYYKEYTISFLSVMPQMISIKMSHSTQEKPDIELCKVQAALTDGQFIMLLHLGINFNFNLPVKQKGRIFYYGVMALLK